MKHFVDITEMTNLRANPRKGMARERYRQHDLAPDRSAAP
jgi:hypothetical protein